MKQTRRPSSGFNLIEAAIVLGVVGLVIGGIWVAAAAVTESNRQSQTLKDMLTITENLRKRFSPHIEFGCASKFYEFNDTGMVCNFIPISNWGGLIPPTMISSSIVPINAWGGAFSVAIYGMDNGGYIKYTLSGIPRSTCAKLAPAIAAALSRTSNLSVTNSAAANQSLLTPALAAANCYLGTAGNIAVRFDR